MCIFDLPMKNGGFFHRQPAAGHQFKGAPKRRLRPRSNSRGRATRDLKACDRSWEVDITSDSKGIFVGLIH